MHDEFEIDVQETTEVIPERPPYTPEEARRLVIEHSMSMRPRDFDYSAAAVYMQGQPKWLIDALREDGYLGRHSQTGKLYVYGKRPC